MTKRILIADDHHVVRVGTFMILKEAYSDLFANFASTYEEVKEKLASDNFNLVILDIDMPGSIYKSMVKELRAIQKDIAILVFSSYDENIALQYYKEGVNGFLNKLNPPDNLIMAIDTIYQKGTYYSPYIINQILENKESSPVQLLSERELEVFNLLAQGIGNLEIANKLNLEQTTIATHKRRLYKKLKITNLADLIKIYNAIH